MFQKFFSFFRSRHYWRTVSFSEIAELYVSRLLTIFATNVVSLFAAVYLYKLGYSLLFIAFFYIATYVVKVLTMPFIAKYVAFYGPKHGVLVSSLLRIPALLAFAFVEQWGLVSIIVFGVFQQMAIGAYNISYLVDFSKVKHRKHAGKEIGVMEILERTANLVSPLIGGFIATLVSPTVTILVAAVAFVIATIPLFYTKEPTPTRMKIKILGFPWQTAWRSLVAHLGIGFGNVTGVTVWALFLVTVVFYNAGDDVYAIIGTLGSIGALVSIFVARVVGKMIDKNKGRPLYLYGLLGNSLVFAARPFVSTMFGALLARVLADITSVMLFMPLVRVIFDVADSSGHRVTYITLLEIISAFGRMLAWAIFAGLLVLVSAKTSLQLMLIFAGVMNGLLLLVLRRIPR